LYEIPNIIKVFNNKNIFMPDKLDEAIAEFEDETLDLTLGERISGLRQALLWNSYHAIKRIKKFGSKHPISEEEEYKQIECMRHFKDIEKMYTSEVKANKLLGKPDDVMNVDFLKKIKEMKGSMGEIVRDLNPLNKVV
jgi:uncharacterized protein YktA (UPF0223 family)